MAGLLIGSFMRQPCRPEEEKGERYTATGSVQIEMMFNVVVD